MMDDLFGFTFHHAGVGERVHARYNTFINTANGLNANGDYSQQIGNILTNAEAIEASGANCLIADNMINGGATSGTAISIGGRTGGTPSYGTIVRNNIINVNAPSAITIAEGTQRALIENNTISNAGENGINVVYSFEGAPAIKDNVIRGNVIYANTRGIYINTSGGANRIEGNIAVVTGSGFGVGIITYTADQDIIGNDFKGQAANGDVYLTDNAANTLVQGNILRNNFVRVDGALASLRYMTRQSYALSIAAGANTSVTVNVVGASVGDKVSVTYTQPLLGVRLEGEVTSAGVVTVKFTNNTASAVTYAGGTLQVETSKFN